MQTTSDRYFILDVYILLAEHGYTRTEVELVCTEAACYIAMLYVVAILVFFAALVCITFAKDSYINRELYAYQRMLQEPWLNRTVLLKYKE